jgi:hypothetical protein
MHVSSFYLRLSRIRLHSRAEGRVRSGFIDPAVRRKWNGRANFKSTGGIKPVHCFYEERADIAWQKARVEPCLKR